MTAELCVGLMSGTSLDGVDAVLAAFDPAGGSPFRCLGHQHVPFPAALRNSLLTLNTSGPDELHLAALAGNDLARAYAVAVDRLLTTCGTAPSSIAALGAHGQTVRHRPGEFDGCGYTLQLLNGALLAELTHIDVICDFRSRDVAAGGQGAPLVPAFHHAVFGVSGQARAILNIGGMANLTLLDPNGQVGGFDCGPGNVLMDLWCERHLGQPYDSDGDWAATGRSDPGLLAAMMNDTFIGRAPPKSTGRDHFNAGWLNGVLLAASPDCTTLAPADVQATLLDFTAVAAATALKMALPSTRTLLVCGGGALNVTLMRRLSACLPGVTVESSGVAGLDPMHVEAAAFAWLAHAYLHHQSANLPAVTGAAGYRPLGALHRARARD